MHLVTGGSGFLGSNLARILCRRGERVRVLDLRDAPDRLEGIEFVPCDILDREGVRRAMRGVRYVHHNAALVPLTKSGRRLGEVNQEGTRVALACAREEGVEMFVHMSSSAVYGTPSCPVREDSPRKPVERYGRAKLAAEEEVFAAAADGFPCAVIRPRTIIGRGRLGIFAILFEWIREGRVVYIIGPGNELLQFAHVEDICEASILCARLGKKGVFNVGTDRFGTLREDVGALITHAGTGSRISSLPVGLAIPALGVLDLLGLSPLAPWHYLTYHKPFWLDVSKAEDELGWVARYGNQEMLIESYDWYLRNREKTWNNGSSPHRRSTRQGILGLLRRFS